MKATVIVRLKPEVLDVQGSAVQRALGKLGFEGVQSVRIGKIVELDIEDGDAKEVEARLNKMAKEMLANPVIEDFETRISS
jgi:phosphoribosylformylglycinamidine synthase